jgi:hypothetical protein
MRPNSVGASWDIGIVAPSNANDPRPWTVPGGAVCPHGAPVLSGTLDQVIAPCAAGQTSQYPHRRVPWHTDVAPVPLTCRECLCQPKRARRHEQPTNSSA